MPLENATAISEETPVFSVIYESYFHEVQRWSRSLGAPEADLEDLSQQVFLVVHRKLSSFDGGNLRGWLYRITARTVSDYRRRSWFRNMFRKRSEADPEQLLVSTEDPAAGVHQAEARRLALEILGKMSEKRRVAFALFEFEGYSGKEIAEVLEIPLGTVWTRLQAAHREFSARVAERLQQEER